MKCAEFVQSFSEIQDGIAPEGVRRDAEAHLRVCPSCRRYRRVVVQGGELLRSLPALEVPEDFRPRLRHRLYHVADEVALAEHTGSGTSALTALGMAVILTVVAWSPALRREPPVVDLEPIVVSRPPVRFAGLSARAPLGTSRSVLWDGSRGLWDDAPALLLEYSPLSGRYSRRPTLRRTGLEQDHQ